MTVRHVVPTALALTAGSLAVGLPATAGAAPVTVPQYVVQFSATVLPPATTTGLEFHSSSCAIGPATDPIVVLCQESGTIAFTAKGGSGTATVTSALSTIDWTYRLHRVSASATAGPTEYAMVGKGTASEGASPVVRAVKVTGTLTVLPTPGPTIRGTEDVYPVPASAA